MIKRPRRETENQQRHITTRKDDRDLTPNCVLLQIVHGTVVPSHVAKKRDVRYGNTIKIISNVCVCVCVCVCGVCVCVCGVCVCVCVLLDVQETINSITSWICHAL